MPIIINMKCKCGGVLQENDGELFCSECGQAQEAILFANHLTFNDYQLAGSNIDMGNPQGRFSRRTEEDPTTRRMHRAEEEIRRLTVQLELSDEERTTALDQSLRIVKLADIFAFFSKGKSIRLYSAASLYIALRLAQAPYLLIDFTDKMGENLFKLARCYLRLVKKLHLNYKMPLLDPAVFILKYLRNLGIPPEKVYEVGETSVRLVQRMKRDWMCQGRRPSSICGAAILIAAKFAGVAVTLAQISKTVFVCEETIRRRLDEFKDTPIARLTTEQFKEMKNNLHEIEEEMDPPALIRNRLRQKQDHSLSDQSSKLANPLEDSFEAPSPKELEATPAKEFVELKDSREDSGEILDEEIECFILSPKEKVLKQKLWRQLNKDWLEREEFRSTEAQKPKHPRKAKKKDEVYGSVEEALKSTKLGARYSEQELKNLLEFGKKKEVGMDPYYNPFQFS
jgi:transcription factor IIIB subunit 2